jgi:hypothetical protein
MASRIILRLQELSRLILSELRGLWQRYLREASAIGSIDAPSDALASREGLVCYQCLNSGMQMRKDSIWPCFFAQCQLNSLARIAMLCMDMIILQAAML